MVAVGRGAVGRRDGRAGMDVHVLARAGGRRRCHRGGRLQRGAAEDLAVARPAAVGPLADQAVGHADERGHVLGGGALVDVLGRVVLLDAAVAHDGQPVAEGERLGLVVGDEHGREAEPTVELVDLGPHLIAEAGVEVAERLVEEHEVGSGDESTGEGDALLLATAELGRIAVEQRAAVDERGRLLDPPVLQAVLDLAGLQRVGDVLAHRHVRPQRVRLEHHADVALVRRAG